MCQTFSYITFSYITFSSIYGRSSCMAMGAPFACLRHLHGCGTCTGAAYAWMRHLHCCVNSICAAYSRSYLVGHHQGEAASLCSLPRLVHLATLPCLWPIAAFALACATILHEGSHQGEAPSEVRVPRLGPSYKAGMG